jgi:hypothetical protein
MLISPFFAGHYCHLPTEQQIPVEQYRRHHEESWATDPCLHTWVAE